MRKSVALYKTSHKRYLVMVEKFKFFFMLNLQRAKTNFICKQNKRKWAWNVIEFLLMYLCILEKYTVRLYYKFILNYLEMIFSITCHFATIRGYNCLGGSKRLLPKTRSTLLYKRKKLKHFKLPVSHNI